LLIHALIIIPVLYLITARKNPVRYYVGLRDAIITAFGTSSRYVYRVQNSSRHFVHSCRRFFTQEIEKKCHPIPWSAKSTSLERLSKHFTSESNAAMKHLHTYQKWIGWCFKSFLNKNTTTANYRTLIIIVSTFVDQAFVLATISICRHSFFPGIVSLRDQQRDFWGNSVLF